MELVRVLHCIVLTYLLILILQLQIHHITLQSLRLRAVAAMANGLRQLIDTANAPIFGIDVRGTVNEWNNKTAQITGYSRDEAIGKPLVSTFIVKNLRDSVQRVMDQALQGNETSNYELEFRTKVSRAICYMLHTMTFCSICCFVSPPTNCIFFKFSQMKFAICWLMLRPAAMLITILLE